MTKQSLWHDGSICITGVQRYWYTNNGMLIVLLEQTNCPTNYLYEVWRNVLPNTGDRYHNDTYKFYGPYTTFEAAQLAAKFIPLGPFLP
jgi:hypothetical protein